MKKALAIGCGSIVAVMLLLVVLVFISADDSEEEATPEADRLQSVESSPVASSSIDWDEVAARRAAEPDGPGYTVLVYMNGSDLESTWDEEYEEYNGAASITWMRCSGGSQATKFRSSWRRAGRRRGSSRTSTVLRTSGGSWRTAV